MDYKEKYEKLHKNTLAALQQMVSEGKIAEEIARSICADFVKESEDERIRKTLIELVRMLDENPLGQIFGYGDIKYSDMIAWLEKQGNNWNDAHDFRPKHLQRCLCYDKYMGGVYCYVYDDIDKYWCTQTTVVHDPDGDNHICDYADYRVTMWMSIPSTSFYSSKKQGEQKSSDKVEPKFKVGDWIVREYSNVNTVNQVINVKQIDDECFGYTLDDKTYFSGSWESSYRLWTIQDAKDGDVLADNDVTIIFRKIGNNTWNDVVDYYVGYNHSLDKITIQSGKSHYGKINKVTFKPATKEQCDLLFQKMKEAGYEWDDEKKELKKIESKHAWSEEDKKMLERIIESIYISLSGCEEDDDIKDMYNEEIDWLKSLKERMKGGGE